MNKKLSEEHKRNISLSMKAKFKENYGIKCKDSSGYILIKIKDRGWIKEHRYIMEQYLKRKLENNEDVHHINGIRDDNRIENLEVLFHGEHSSKTHKNRKHDINCQCCFCKAKQGMIFGAENPNYKHGKSHNKEFKKERDKLYYLKNKEKIKKRVLEYYYKNK